MPQIPDYKIPIKVKDSLGVTSTHKLAFFDDQDNLLEAQLEFNKSGIILRSDIISRIAEKARSIEAKIF